MTGIRRTLLAGVVALATTTTSAGAAIFGLIDTGELYSSTNGGATWSILATLPVNDAVGLAAGSSTSQLYIATRSGSVYRSVNAGATWTAVGAISASDIASFTINYDGSLLTLTESGTVYRSTDGGATFAGLAALTGSNFISLARGPLGRHYALTRTGEVYESQNQGTSWSAVGGVAVSNAVSIRRREAELHLLTETGEVYRSLDYGRSWLAVGAITANNMRAILDAGTTLVAAAGTGEVYASADGSVWSTAGAINQLTVMALGTDTPLVTGVEQNPSAPRFVVRAPYPNPRVGRGGATFPFTIAGPDRVRLDLFGVDGRLVASRSEESFASPGVYAIRWDPEQLHAGTYVVRLTTASGRSASAKWTLAR
ncbi:MAG TPA: hypothetical protein VJW75_11615 [Candidatus Eisenbacteria bacterium]|nr:hypothetical protein [Candidatus Eisenbacteria bacterium]